MSSTTGKEISASKDCLWMNWCRLCGCRDDTRSRSIFNKNNTSDSTLATSIGKYFWVNITAEDEITKTICKECNELVTELITFTDRVNKVQTMYCLLQTLKPSSVADANKLRSQCGIVEDWEHIIKEKQQPLLKPTTVNQEVQTDLVIFFNSDSCNRTKDTISKTQLGRDDILMEIEQEGEQTYDYIEEGSRSKNTSEGNRGTEEPKGELNEIEAPRKRVKDKEKLMDIGNVSEKTFEYVVQNDGDLVEIEAQQYRDNNVKLKIHDVDAEQDDETELEDSDLFKELKFKVDDNDADDFKSELMLSKDVNDERKEIHNLENDNDSEELGEEYVEMNDEEDYEELIDESSQHQNESTTSSAFDLLRKRKRGRPSLGSKSSVYRYECVDCKRKYKNPTVYRKHMQSTHGQIIEHLPDFECQVCQKDCFNQSRLKLHMRLHLPDEKKLVVPCPYCDRKFSQLGAMRQHVNGIHHELKPYICDQCGRACKTLAALNEHQLVHTDECPYVCEVCKKAFKNKARLKAHMDTHNESEYTCPDCGLKLNTRRTLLQHRLVHSNVKRFKCEFCEAAFKRSKSLKNHLLLHSGLRPYKCQFCDKSFSNGSNCRSHKRRVHPTELAKEEAMGKKNEPVPIPKLEDLKAAKTALVQPRKINRQPSDLPTQLRKILKTTEESEDDTYELSDIHYEIEEEIEDDEWEEHHYVDGCEETVIYEIIDEI